MLAFISHTPKATERATSIQRHDKIDTYWPLLRLDIYNGTLWEVPLYKVSEEVGCMWARNQDHLISLLYIIVVYYILSGEILALWRGTYLDFLKYVYNFIKFEFSILQ